MSDPSSLEWGAEGEPPLANSVEIAALNSVESTRARLMLVEQAFEQVVLGKDGKIGMYSASLSTAAEEKDERSEKERFESDTERTAARAMKLVEKLLVLSPDRGVRAYIGSTYVGERVGSEFSKRDPNTWAWSGASSRASSQTGWGSLANVLIVLECLVDVPEALSDFGATKEHYTRLYERRVSQLVTELCIGRPEIKPPNAHLGGGKAAKEEKAAGVVYVRLSLGPPREWSGELQSTVWMKEDMVLGLSHVSATYGPADNEVPDEEKMHYRVNTIAFTIDFWYEDGCVAEALYDVWTYTGASSMDCESIMEYAQEMAQNIWQSEYADRPGIRESPLSYKKFSQLTLDA